MRTCAVDAGDLEVVEQLHGAEAERVAEVAVAHALEQADLVERRLRVVLRAPHHLHRHEALGAARTRSRPRHWLWLLALALGILNWYSYVR